MKGLTDIPGIKVGHASDFEALTGVTAIICEQGAVAGGDIRGSATGTQEWDTLNPLHVTPMIHGIVFAGGSAFGLEAASGVRRHLSAKGIGFDTRVAKVPIIPGAIIYDLAIGRADVRPTREMGEVAAVAANDGPVKEGGIGAGTGATVGKILGMKNAMKSGIGTFTVQTGKVLVSALAVVNAYGDVVDPATGKVVAGTRVSPTSRTFAGGAEIVKKGTPQSLGNTTLVAIATNARLTKVEATKLAQLGQHGMVKAISPVHTMGDGDVVIAMSVGSERAPMNALGVAASEAVSAAILRAVRTTSGAGGLPGLKDWA